MRKVLIFTCFLSFNFGYFLYFYPLIKISFSQKQASKLTFLNIQGVEKIFLEQIAKSMFSEYFN